MLQSSLLLLLLLCLTLTTTLVTSAPVDRKKNKKNSKDGKEIAKDILNKVKDSIVDYFDGEGTYYEVGTGSCGKQNNDNDMIVALNNSQMKNGANPNKNPECNKSVEITGDNGKTVKAKVMDTCPTCPKGNIDMSPKVFQLVCGNLEKGRCKIKWKFSQ
ncbi:unnamed protein product [Cunninghamella echinulata]